MGKESFFDKLRNLITKVSFTVFLWSIQMTDDEYWRSVAEEEAAEQAHAHDLANRPMSFDSFMQKIDEAIESYEENPPSG